MARWNPSLHPRDEEGKFTDTPGGMSAGEANASLIVRALNGNPGSDSGPEKKDVEGKEVASVDDMVEGYQAEADAAVADAFDRIMLSQDERFKRDINGLHVPQDEDIKNATRLSKFWDSMSDEEFDRLFGGKSRAQTKAMNEAIRRAIRKSGHSF